MHFWQELIDFDYFDIGANYGLTTIPQAIFYKRCGRNNRIYAFEPGQVFPLLQASVRLNGVDDMTYCIRAAASDQSGQVEFHLTPSQSPASSLLSAAVKRPGVVQSRPISVTACRLDEFVTQTRYTRGMIVKIDAEGADFRVLRGMRHIRDTRLAVIQIEFYPVLVESYTNPERELVALLHSYIVVELGGARNRRIVPEEARSFIAAVRRLPMPATDLLLIPPNLPGAERLVARVLDN